jgi:hypothetical protein
MENQNNAAFSTLGSRLHGLRAGLNQAAAVLLRPSQLQTVPKALAFRRIVPQKMLEMHRHGPSAHH